MRKRIIIPGKIGAGALDNFLAEHKKLELNKHVFLLPVGNVEEYYPEALPEQLGDPGKTISKWCRSSIEAEAMTGPQRVLVKEVGSKITLEQFKAMDIVSKAIETRQRLAFL